MSHERSSGANEIGDGFFLGRGGGGAGESHLWLVDRSGQGMFGDGAEEGGEDKVGLLRYLEVC